MREHADRDNTQGKDNEEREKGGQSSRAHKEAAIRKQRNEKLKTKQIKGSNNASLCQGGKTLTHQTHLVEEKSKGMRKHEP